MNQYMTDFTPWQSLGGGLLIGAAAVLLMYYRGRIFGATGILSGVLFVRNEEQGWRIALLLGMVCGPLVVWLVTGTMPEVTVPVGYPALIIGGFLVGVGVMFGSGCTSGHGVCGLARFSQRSLVATSTFMASTAITVFVVRHVLGG